MRVGVPVRRKIAGVIHRFAYWLDRNVDEVVRPCVDGVIIVTANGVTRMCEPSRDPFWREIEDG